jgi:hypothetical protein
VPSTKAAFPKIGPEGTAANSPALQRRGKQESRGKSRSPSQVVREGLRMLAACRLGKTHPRIVGLGKFDSGIKDLGSNKEHLKDFGR